MSGTRTLGSLASESERAPGPGEGVGRHDSPAALMWRKFVRHRAALVSGVVIILLYLVALFAEFFSPWSPAERHAAYPLAPPQTVRFVDTQGRLHLRPFVYGLSRSVDPSTFTLTYQEDRTRQYPLRLFVRGDSYRLLGLIEWDVHLFGVSDQDAPFFLMGTDQQARDLFSRVLLGARVSLSVGLIGVALSLVLGVVIGGVSGYFGGAIDNIVQRLIEVLRSFPTLPLWMALGAALPPEWPVVRTYFFITLILSLLGWTGMARVVRGKFLSLREEEFVVAARLSGARTGRVIFRHLLPSFSSHIIATATLSIPGIILGETALSFLGVGMRPPAVSWGVLLQDAQNVHAVVATPWLMLPALFVVVTVLAFNFLGDGIRDAADPHHEGR